MDKHYKKVIPVALMILVSALFGAANASVINLTNKCSTGDSINGISTADVNGNAGGASDCWGTFDGNDGGSGVELTDGTTSWDFISKKNIGGGIEGQDIGLTLPTNDGRTGSWEFDSGLNFESYIIVLKAASKPGWAAYLFSGSDADSYYGDWSVAWDKDLSHFSVYAKEGTYELPEPFALLLFGAGLISFGFFAARKK